MSIAFLVTALVVVATPGTGALYTLAAGLGRGARAGVLAAFACTLGIVPHIAAAVTGTAALLDRSAVAFQTVKILGVLYLLYMAVATWRDRSELVVADRAAPTTRRVLTQGVLVNLLNPKLTIFFFAFLPQFVPAHGAHTLARMLLLSAVFMAMTFTVFAGYGMCAAAVRTRVVARPHLVRRLRRSFAVTFVALGARLAVQGR